MPNSWNYYGTSNETDKIKDRFLKYYIFRNYFHDSLIKQVCFVDDGRTLKIVLSCEIEWSSRGDYANPEYEYVMYFRDCRYFEQEWMPSRGNRPLEFIEATFKKSAKLFEIEETFRKKYFGRRIRRKNYYHLRIELAEGYQGSYLDIIFNRFEIVKTKGLIVLPNRIAIPWYFSFVRDKFKNENIEKVRKIAESGDGLERRDAIEYLGLTKDTQTYDLAINGLDEENEEYDVDVRMASLHVLGNLGRSECLPIITGLLDDIYLTPVGRRNTQDAIDKILSSKL